MKIDLFHNKIIKDTATPAFIDSVNNSLIPKLLGKYGDELECVQMYEDYISSGLTKGGYFYYPLTLVVSSQLVRQWIKWRVDKRIFENAVPYSYKGTARLAIELVEDVPEEISIKIDEKIGYFDKECVNFNIQTVAEDKTFLCGKYSQSFVDEMVRQLSYAIEKFFSVSGIEKSTVEVHMVFAPGTYMEHVSCGVTYRRLLMSAKGCGARDFWIMWKSASGDKIYTVSDRVESEDIVFEIADNVPQKIREKEYRFLVRTSSDKYQYAMGRKNVTEWKELIKRVVKRGELIKLAVEENDEIFDTSITARLHEALTLDAALDEMQEQTSTQPEENVQDSDLSALLKNALGIMDTVPQETVAEEAKPEQADKEFDEPPFDVAEEEKIEEAEILGDDIEAKPSELENEQPSSNLEEELRAKIERELKEKYELEAKQKAEEENERLRREHEQLLAENERLVALAREAEEQKLLRESELQAESEKLKREIEAKERQEEIEKERLREAARLAVIEQQKYEAERQAALEERLANEERERLERERQEREAAIKAEEARIRAEIERKALEEQRAKEEKKASIAEAIAPQYNYVSKNARLLFKRPVDPNITKRIHEIIITTIKYFKKEDVYIKIKATIPDSTTINLNFVKIPEEETELLINIIKVLGKSDLGITKVYLE